MPDWVKLLLGLGGVGAVGAAGAVAKSTKKPAEESKADTWVQVARNEYAKPEEPISARSSDLSKIGAPVAASAAAILAAVGGWVSDAPKGDTIIAVAIILAVAVGGLLYVFATDFRARAAVAVARFESLAQLAVTEAQAAPEVQDESDAVELEEGQLIREKPERTSVSGETEPVSAQPPSWVPLEPQQAMAGGRDVLVYGLVSTRTTPAFYLVLVPGEQFVWMPATQVTFPDGLRA